MVLLQYLGARELKFKDPRFKHEYDFINRHKICLVDPSDAKVLLNESPCVFHILHQEDEYGNTRRNKG
jgi:hypothetical protein